MDCVLHLGTVDRDRRNPAVLRDLEVPVPRVVHQTPLCVRGRCSSPGLKRWSPSGPPTTGSPVSSPRSLNCYYTIALSARWPGAGSERTWSSRAPPRPMADLPAFALVTLGPKDEPRPPQPLLRGPLLKDTGRRRQARRPEPTHRRHVLARRRRQHRAAPLRAPVLAGARSPTWRRSPNFPQVPPPSPVVEEVVPFLQHLPLRADTGATVDLTVSP